MTKDVHISLTLPAEYKELLTAIAAEEGITVAEFLRRLMEEDQS